MLCPKCQNENFEKEKPCSGCGFQGDPNMLDDLDHFQWLLSQTDKWENFDIEPVTVSKLRKIFTSQLIDLQVALGLRFPPFTPKEAEKAWEELVQLETLFKKVDEWRNAGYFKEEMESLDPVRRQRVLADELSQRLVGYQRPELSQSDQDRLKMVNSLLDNVDLIASRHWFKSRKEIEKVVVPIMAMMVAVISENKPDDAMGQQEGISCEHDVCHEETISMKNDGDKDP
jgi:hypothetical protein